MADYCSDCSNLDCSCFKKFVQNVSKRNVPSTSARISLLNNLFTLVGTMQYNIFSDAFIEEIKNSPNRKDQILYIDCSDIKLTVLAEKIQNLKAVISTKIKPPDVNSSSSSSSSSDASEINYEKFMNRIYNQLERTTFLYGKPNNNILYYEEKFYYLYNNEIYKTTFSKLACGVFNKDNNIYICSSGFKNNIFNIFYALKSIPYIRLNEHKETIGKNLIIILKMFIYNQLLEFNEIFRSANLTIKHTKEGEENKENKVIISNITTDYTSFYQNLLKLFGDPITEGVQEGEFKYKAGVIQKFRQLNIGNNNFLRFQLNSISKFEEDRKNLLSKFTFYNGNIDTIIADFQEILINTGLIDHVEADIKSGSNLNKPELISKCLQETNLIENCNPEIYSETLIQDITLPDNLSLYDDVRKIYLNFIENVEYRDNYYRNQHDRTQIKNQYIPFKRLNKNLVRCSNGTECAEPKLFNWLIKNNIIEIGKKPEFFSCFWHGSNSGNMTMYVPKTGEDKKKLFLLGYYSYLLENKAPIPIKSFLVPEKLNPVFNNIMFPCSGCQINYDDILNNKITDPNYSWDSSSCGTVIPLYDTIYSVPVSRSNSGENEQYEEEQYGSGPKHFPWYNAVKKTNKSRHNKTKTNKSRPNKTKKIKKSKKSKTRKTKGKKRHNSCKLR